MEYALLIIVSAVVAVALWPGFLLTMDGCLKIYRRLKAPYVVTCPATEEPAALELAVSAPSVFSNSCGPRPHVRRCSRWPEHEQCAQACLGQLDSSVDATPREGLEGIEVGIEMGGRPSRSQHGARSASSKTRCHRSRSQIRNFFSAAVKTTSRLSPAYWRKVGGRRMRPCLSMSQSWARAT